MKQHKVVDNSELEESTNEVTGGLCGSGYPEVDVCQVCIEGVDAKVSDLVICEQDKLRVFKQFMV